MKINIKNDRQVVTIKPHVGPKTPKIVKTEEQTIIIKPLINNEQGTTVTIPLQGKIRIIK